MISRFTIFILFIIAFLGFSDTLSAASRYWVSSSSSNWNNTSNWSASSGGGGGASVPTSSDYAYFNSGGNGNCTVDATVDVAGFNMNGYSGTFTNSSNNFTCGGNFYLYTGTFNAGSGLMTINNQLWMYGGTFNGGSGNLDLNHYFNFSGGTFTAPSGTFYAAKYWAHSSGGTFNHNNGTVEFDGTTNSRITFLNGKETFYNLTFNKSSGYIYLYLENDTVEAENDMLFTLGNTLSWNSKDNVFEVGGDATVSSSFGTISAYNGVHFSGGGTQNFNCTNAIDKVNGNISMNKTSGTLNIQSNINMESDLLLGNGTLSLNGNTIDSPDGYLRVDGDATINGGGSIMVDFYSQTAGSVVFTGTAITLKTYTDFIISSGTFTGNTTALDIDRIYVQSGGTFNAPSITMYVGLAWNHSSGTFNHNFGTVEFDGSVQNWQGIDFPGSGVDDFFNFTFNKSGCVYEKLMQNDTLVVHGNYNLKSGYFWSRHNEFYSIQNMVMVRGNVDIDPSYCPGEHSNTINFICNGTQTLDLSGDTDNYNGDYVINKTGGEVKLLSDLVLYGYAGYQDLIIGNGTLNLNGYTITISGDSEIKLYNGGSITYNGGSISGSITNMGTNYGTYTEQCSDPVPVELVKFTAVRVNDVNKLNWITASEINNDYFQVEKSVNGTEFYAIGEVSGNGTSQQLNEYSYIDAESVAEACYYRLRQVDFDGEYSLSSIAYVDGLESQNHLLIYPTPGNDIIHLAFGARNPRILSISIIDLSGRVQISEDRISDGSDIMEVDVKNLSTGVYFLRVLTDKREIIQKIQIEH